ncbi:MAG: hypothetical protein OHK0037_27640 [Elainellaceae cyanobacterium]
MLNRQQFVDKYEILALLKISDRTLKRYRAMRWTEGIHYVKPVQRILYNRPLIEDWLVNSDDPQAHDRAIAAFLDTLPSNQPLSRRRRAS